MTSTPTQNKAPVLHTPIGRITVMLCGVTFIVDGILAITTLGSWRGPRLTKKILDRVAKPID